jgi:hypothetical protein
VSARGPGPLAGLAAGAALGAALFGLALLLLQARDDRGDRRPPEGFSRGASDPRTPVRVLASLAGPGPRALLLPLREDGGDPGPAEAILDGDLFPDGPRHRWARLVVSNPAGAPPASVSLAPGAVVLDAPSGPAGNADLAAAFAARAASLPAHRVLDLRVASAPDRAVEVPPGGFVRVLLAFPEGADPREASGATIGGSLRLLPREVPLDRVRTALHGGDLEDLPDSVRVEVPPPARETPGAPR